VLVTITANPPMLNLALLNVTWLNRIYLEVVSNTPRAGPVWF